MPDSRTHKSHDLIEERRSKRKRREEAESLKFLAELGYSNEDNPFGDPRLSEKFVWKKRDERNKKLSKKARKRTTLAERIEEIKRVREKRRERSDFKRDLELKKEAEAREREKERYKDWEEKEKTFHESQVEVRSKIRIVQARETVIDSMMKTLILLDEFTEIIENKKDLESINGDSGWVDNTKIGFETPVSDHPPYFLFHSLDTDEIKFISDEIQLLIELEKKRSNKKRVLYWESVNVISKFLLRSLMDGHSKIPREIKEEVNRTVAGKSIDELKQLSVSLKSRAKSSSDSEFWKEVLRGVEAEIAMQYVKNIHSEMMIKRDKAIKLLNIDISKLSMYKKYTEVKVKSEFDQFIEDSEKQFQEMKKASANLLPQSVEDMWDNDYVKLDEKLMLEIDEIKTNIPDGLKKPQYFNKIKIGYHWTPYNQVHYDADNPPPKQVKGYKFNIFYPGMETPPKFERIPIEFEREEGDLEKYVGLKFTASAPYADLCFKIVNREWDTGPYSGFRSVYENGILHLYFNFRNVTYRK